MKLICNIFYSQEYPGYTDSSGWVRGLVGGAWLSPIILLLLISTLITLGLYVSDRQRKKQEESEQIKIVPL